MITNRRNPYNTLIEYNTKFLVDIKSRFTHPIEMIASNIIYMRYISSLYYDLIVLAEEIK